MIEIDKASVLVTGIGGNVAQGVLRCLRADFPKLRIIGLDINSFTAGQHFCDRVFKVPYADDKKYVSVIESILLEEPVDLAIPCTDAETVYLGEVKKLSGKLLGGGSHNANLFLDKYITSQEFQKHGIPFAESFLPSEYDGRWASVIAKPRQGRGSRGLHINPPRFQDFDDSYIIQPLLEGTEITCAFYATKSGSLHGSIIFSRELQNGMTERCTVRQEFSSAVNSIAEEMISAFSIVGPCNIQAKVLEDGRVVPFEINYRYSGTNSIRSQLGFPDVRFGIQEHLLKQEPEPPLIKNGSAIRVLMDIIYPDSNLSDEVKAGSSDSYIF